MYLCISIYHTRQQNATLETFLLLLQIVAYHYSVKIFKRCTDLYYS